jgi:hypothetical protein
MFFVTESQLLFFHCSTAEWMRKSIDHLLTTIKFIPIQRVRNAHVYDLLSSTKHVSKKLKLVLLFVCSWRATDLLPASEIATIAMHSRRLPAMIDDLGSQNLDVSREDRT